MFGKRSREISKSGDKTLSFANLGKGSKELLEDAPGVNHKKDHKTQKDTSLEKPHAAQNVPTPLKAKLKREKLEDALENKQQNTLGGRQHSSRDQAKSSDPISDDWIDEKSEDTHRRTSPWLLTGHSDTSETRVPTSHSDPPKSRDLTSRSDTSKNTQHLHPLPHPPHMDSSRARSISNPRRSASQQRPDLDKIHYQQQRYAPTTAHFDNQKPRSRKNSTHRRTGSKSKPQGQFTFSATRVAANKLYTVKLVLLKEAYLHLLESTKLRFLEQVDGGQTSANIIQALNSLGKYVFVVVSQMTLPFNANSVLKDNPGFHKAEEKLVIPGRKNIYKILQMVLRAFISILSKHNKPHTLDEREQQIFKEGLDKLLVETLKPENKDNAPYIPYMNLGDIRGHVKMAVEAAPKSKMRADLLYKEKLKTYFKQIAGVARSLWHSYPRVEMLGGNDLNSRAIIKSIKKMSCPHGTGTTSTSGLLRLSLDMVNENKSHFGKNTALWEFLGEAIANAKKTGPDALMQHCLANQACSAGVRCAHSKPSDAGKNLLIAHTVTP